jgi:trans-aconitate methyltransferase
VFRGDFNSYSAPERKFDLVWASHVLEHQRNVGTFLDRLVDCCGDGGFICITVPDPHRHLWGGHLTLWSPGLLAYNIVLSGLDISAAKFIRGTNEFSILFTPKKVSLPRLTFDYGDLKLLEAYLPGQLTEYADPWRVW